MRQKGDYDIYADFGEAGVRESVTKAERFLNWTKSLAG